MNTNKYTVILGLISLLVHLPTIAAQSKRQELEKVSAVKELAGGVELASGKALVRVTAINDSVIRVRVARDGKFPDDHSWAVLPTSTAPPAVKVSDSRQAVEFSVTAGKVRVEKNLLRITFLDQTGKVLQTETRPMAFDGDAFHVWLSMPEDEHYYGLGDKAGPLDHRVSSYTMWNTDQFGWQESTDPLYKDIPFFMALRHGVAHGVFLDNTYRSDFDLGRAVPDTLSFGAAGGELNYYFFFGPEPKKVLSEYTAMVGRSPLPPLWSLGFQQSRYSYYPEARVREIAKTFREHKIPADVLYLDIDYQQGNAPFTVDRTKFPNFEGMIKDLGQDGFKIITITDLHIKKEPGYKPYDEGIAGDDFVKNPDGSVFVGVVWPGESVFPDFTLDRVRRWWGSLYKDFVAMGVAGFWNDMNEPALFERADKTMPLDVVHRIDWGGTETHRAIHNVYGMENVRGTYEGLLRLKPEQRPFVLTRAAYAGTQRYTATWTGDNTSSWNHMRMMVPQILNMGLSGYPLVGADIGGFVGSPSPELLTRWIELGAFTPIYRDHTAKGTLDQEPWVHGPEHEAIRKRYIELRYQLLPYIYTSVEETTRTGIPLMRPIFLEYPQAENLYNEIDEGHLLEYLFGRDLLVAPREAEMQDKLHISLPPGAWYDFWSGKKIIGSEEIEVDPALAEVPVFVRAGAIIPEQPVVQSTSQKPDGPLRLLVYPGEDCKGSIYLDDGVSFQYKSGDYLRLNFTCQASAAGVSVKLASQEGNFQPWWSQMQLDIFGVEARPAQVMVGAAAATGWNYDQSAGRVSVTIPNPASGTEVAVQR